ncbi:alpha/beta hydrolase [Streptomyces lydicus]|uniref:alpha/beta hydrolase n=1 Tax=Streptomyces lydicus TaxID=47763 RepID=UPI00286FCECB|nr:hypothetical protein [Streptomyces lydicus]
MPVPHPERRKRARLLGAVVAALGLVLFPVVKYGNVCPDTGKPMAFGRPLAGHPRAAFRTASTLADGTRIGVTTLHGKKSGFTGKVWAWAPPEYYQERYRDSAFPVLIALPGGRGCPANYWNRPRLGLQQAVTDLAALGRSKPFVLVMPQLNPDPRHYYDGSDIPGRPKIGTWLSDDVPDLVRATFRTFTSRDGWALMGSSSGGFVGLRWRCSIRTASGRCSPAGRTSARTRRSGGATRRSGARTTPSASPRTCPPVPAPRPCTSSSR